MISTRGTYALNVIIDLAENAKDGEPLPMRTVAARQGISLKYLEQILPMLTRGGLVEGVLGKGGGYRLLKDPSQISVYDIVSLTEVGLAPVGCLEQDAEDCPRSLECRARPMWQKLNTVISDFLTGVTIEDLMKEPDLA